MSKSEAGSTISTEQTGRSRNGTKQRTTSGSDVTNYTDLPNLPKIRVERRNEIKDFKADFNMSAVPNAEIAAMFGALNGSKFTINKVEQPEPGTKFQYIAIIKNKFLDIPQERTITLYNDGRKEISNDYFFLKTKKNPDGTSSVLPEYKNQGIGTKSLARQAIYANKHGVSKINAFGLRNDESGDVGYYVWAVLGFDRNLKASEKAVARNFFKDDSISTVRDIISKPDGDKFWFTNGNSGDMVFNLKAGSGSFKTMTAYAKNKLSKKVRKIW